MNKETIYIEPSDDITDVLSKLKSSDSKVIALVPPKKPTVLLSSVNIKLIARTAKAEKKAVVLVSTDDSLIKLAMTANLPVAPSLKSRPTMPGETAEAPAEAEKPAEEKEAEADKEEPEETDPEEEESDQEEEDDDSEDDEPEEKDKDDEEEDKEEEEEKPAKKDKKAEKTKKSKKSKKDDDDDDDDEEAERTGIKGWIYDHKAWLIFGSITAVLLTVFLVWAFTIAPRVKVSVSVRTTASNFSENVTFTKNATDEDSSTGKFYAHEEKVEDEKSVKFTATGKKDMGEPAAGSLVVQYYFSSYNGAVVTIGTDTSFTYNGFSYVPTSEVSIVGPNGKSASKLSVCENYSAEFDPDTDACLLSTPVAVKAVAPGEDYNISEATSFNDWTTTKPGLYAHNETAISGGTSRVVTIVQQSDVDLALEKLRSENSENGKNTLLGKLGNNVMVIEASYKVSTEDPKVTPAVGSEVGEGTTPEVSTKTTYTVLTVDNVRIDEFIKKKANVEEGKRLYSTGEPFLEYFAEAEGGIYTAKLKTTYKVGPEISETEVLEKIKGEKIGRLEPVLKDNFPGVSSVKAEKSYFWVNSVPSDDNKVEIVLTVEE